MYTGRTIFAQLTDFLLTRRFQTLVRRYHGDHKMRTFSFLDQLYTMIFAQLTCCESLRDIEACLSARPSQQYHPGIRWRVRRSTLRDANESRDARLFEEFAKPLIAETRHLYVAEPMGVNLDTTVYAFDSTTISLCFELFPWAQFRRQKAAIKLHTLIDLRGNIPSFILISTGKMHDIRTLDELSIEPGAFYLMDKGYIDYAHLYHIKDSCAFFVIRLKDSARYRVVQSQTVDKTTGILCDQVIRLTGTQSVTDHPEPMRRVKYRHAETGQTYVFLKGKKGTTQNGMNLSCKIFLYQGLA